MRTQWEEVWTFDTPRFRIVGEVAPEDMDPADSFQFDEDIEAVRSGSVEWFQVRVRVLFGDDLDNLKELGADYLGGCAYNSVDEFLEGHRDPDPMNRNCSTMRTVRGSEVVVCHYWPSMVSEAIGSARKEIGRIAALAATMRAA